MIDIIDKYRPRDYSLVIHDRGIVLCDKQEGALMCFRFAEDVERLRALLTSIDIKRLPLSEEANRAE